jgi:hypothetical protein
MNKIIDETTDKIMEETLDQVISEIVKHTSDLSDKQMIHLFKLLMCKRNYKKPDKNITTDCKDCNNKFNQFTEGGGVCIFCFHNFCTKCIDKEFCPKCDYPWGSLN